MMKRIWIYKGNVKGLMRYLDAAVAAEGALDEAQAEKRTINYHMALETLKAQLKDAGTGITPSDSEIERITKKAREEFNSFLDSLRKAGLS